MKTKKTILVVEDNQDMQTIYKDILGDRYSVVLAGDAETAGHELEKSKVDLMILDIILPKQRGDDFFAEIKKKPKFRKLNVICITVLDDVIRKMKKIDSNTRFLPKPFKSEELLALIEKMP